MNAGSQFVLRACLGGTLVAVAVGCAGPSQTVVAPKNLEYVEVVRPWGPPINYYRPAQASAAPAGPAIVLSKVP